MELGTRTAGSDVTVSSPKAEASAVLEKSRRLSSVIASGFITGMMLTTGCVVTIGSPPPPSLVVVRLPLSRLPIRSFRFWMTSSILESVAFPLSSATI